MSLIKPGGNVVNEYITNEYITNVTGEGGKKSVEQLEGKGIMTIGYDDEGISIFDYAFPVHQSEQMPGTFFVAASRVETAKAYDWGMADTWARLKLMDQAPANQQIKIENHTHTHPMLDTLTREQLHDEFKNSQNLLKEKGFTPTVIAYPGGRQSPLVRHVAQEYFEAGRGVSNTYSNYEIDPYNISSSSFEALTMTQIKSRMDEAKAQNKWLDFYAHAIHPDGQITRPNGVVAPCKTPTQLAEVFQYAKTIGLEVVSYEKAIKTFLPVFYWVDAAGNVPLRINRNGTMNTPT